MIDRFGPLPRPAAELLNVVRLRWEAVRLGMERVKVKNGLDDRPFRRRRRFSLLQERYVHGAFAQSDAAPRPICSQATQYRLAMTVRGIKDVAAGYEVLKSL